MAIEHFQNSPARTAHHIAPHNTTSSQAPVVIACEDASLADEGSLIVAAAGRPSVHASATTASSRARPGSALWRRAPAVFVDLAAARLLEGDLASSGAMFLVRADLQEEDPQLQQRLRPDFSVRLPADNLEVIQALGRWEAGLESPDYSGREESPAAVVGGVGKRNGYCAALTPAVGGAGASVLAAAVAQVLSRDGRTCLVDADEFSGGADLLLGMESAEGLRWQDFAVGEGRLDGAALFEALPAAPSSPSLKVLTSSRARGLSGASRPAPVQVLETVKSLIAAEIAVVVDVPRGAEWMCSVGPIADDFVIVVPTSVRGIAAAGRLAEQCEETGLAPVAAVRQTRHRDISAEEVEFALNIPIVGEVEYLKSLGRDIDVGGLGGGSVSRIVRCMEGLLNRANIADNGGLRAYG